MVNFQDLMDDYRRQLDTGVVQQAYKKLMEYIMGLRSHFASKYPDHNVSGNIYLGYMDMTYFSIIPNTLKASNLKIAVVFLHEKGRFEAWLAGSNKQVQTKYWKLIKTIGWNQYYVLPDLKGMDSIVEHVVADNPNFNDLDALTKQIDCETMKFIKDIEHFLTNQCS